MRDVLIQDCPQVPRPGDQQPIGALSPDGPYPALGTGVRSRATRRDLHHLYTSSGQHGVECVRELPGPVTDQEPEPGGSLPRRRLRRRRPTASPRTGTMTIQVILADDQPLVRAGLPGTPAPRW